VLSEKVLLIDYASPVSPTPGHFAKRDQRGVAPVDFRNYGIMGTHGIQMNGVLPWYGFLDSSCRYKRFCPGLAVLVDPVQKILFLTAHYFTSFILIAQQTRQAVVPCRLSLDV
jgi:hypothetical protein